MELHSSIPFYLIYSWRFLNCKVIYLWIFTYDF